MKRKAALVISAGMGADLAADLKRIARRSGMHLLGPNCLGMQRPHWPQCQRGKPEPWPPGPAGPGQPVRRTDIVHPGLGPQQWRGFSAVVSWGPTRWWIMADVLDFLAADRQTQSIVVYMEGIGNARRFMSALRAAANAKPVVVLKAGRASPRAAMPLPRRTVAHCGQ